MQTKNDWDREVFNGSILIIDELLESEKLDVTDEKIVTTCRHFSDGNNLCGGEYRVIGYTQPQLYELDLAYAITIHKSQGKGYTDVIIIIHSSMYSKMLNRNLLYTAITRAKKRCIIIGDVDGLNECKKIRPMRVTNLFKDLIQYDFVESMMLISDNIGRWVESREICDKLVGLNIANLLEDPLTMKFQKELGKLHSYLFSNAIAIDKIMALLRNGEKKVSVKSDNQVRLEA